MLIKKIFRGLNLSIKFFLLIVSGLVFLATAIFILLVGYGFLGKLGLGIAGIIVFIGVLQYISPILEWLGKPSIDDD